MTKLEALIILEDACIDAKKIKQGLHIIMSKPFEGMKEKSIYEMKLEAMQLENHLEVLRQHILILMEMEK